jgi:hypothetical protein
MPPLEDPPPVPEADPPEPDMGDAEVIPGMAEALLGAEGEAVVPPEDPTLVGWQAASRGAATASVAMAREARFMADLGCASGE